MTTSGTAGPAVVTEGLTKDYGAGRGVFGLCMQVEFGEVVGFLGPNGAGKSTTIRMLLDMVRPTAGRAEVLGVDPRTADPAVRARIGYVPGELSLWRGWRAGEVIGYLADLHGGVDAGRVRALADALDLDLGRPTGQLSKGNKQKVGLVAALAPRSDLLVLDEPTSGLDPLLQVAVQRLLRDAADQGAAVLLSSHLLAEVEGAADRVAIIRQGHLVDVLGMAELRARASQTIEVVFDSAVPPAVAALPGVEALAVDGNVGRYRVTGSVDAFVKTLADHTVLGLRGHDADLEQVFLAYYAGDGP
jgi:ABC-2 type transport system ATP-binding protein